MKTKAKRHFKRPSMEYSSCGIKPFLKTEDIDEVTCLTCSGKAKRDLNANRATIQYITDNNEMGPDEIMTILKRAFKDAEKMHTRASLVANICGLVEHGVMSEQELIDAFEEAMVEGVMEG